MTSMTLSSKGHLRSPENILIWKTVGLAEVAFVVSLLLFFVGFLISGLWSWLA